MPTILKYITQSLLAGDSPYLLIRGPNQGRVLHLLRGVRIHGGVGDIGFGGDLLEDVIVVLPRHQLIDELVRPLDDLVDLLYLLSLHLLVEDPHFLVLVVLPGVAAQGGGQG